VNSGRVYGGIIMNPEKQKRIEERANALWEGGETAGSAISYRVDDQHHLRELSWTDERRR
jgi:hypothetical protein